MDPPDASGHLKKGYFDVPTGPGLGIEIDEKVVKKYVKR